MEGEDAPQIVYEIRTTLVRLNVQLYKFANFVQLAQAVGIPVGCQSTLLSIFLIEGVHGSKN